VGLVGGDSFFLTNVGKICISTKFKIFNMNFNEIRTLWDIKDNSLGFEEKIITTCEKRLNCILPYILRQYYLELGNHSVLNQSQDNLILPSKLKFDKTDFLIFYAENQCVVLWGIKKADFKLKNPPVYTLIDDDEWVLECENLSDFLFSMAHLQAIFAFPYNAHKVGITKDDFKKVTQNWRKIENTLTIWSVEFYQNTSNEILATMQNEDEISLYIAAKTEESFAKVNSQFNIEWDYSSDEDD
jgi:hypothetical protein